MTLPETATRTTRLSLDIPLALQLLLQRFLARIEFGSLAVTLPSGRTMHHRGPRPGPEAVLVVGTWRALWRIFSAGDLGLARAYMDGACRTPDLEALLEFGARNGFSGAAMPADFSLARPLDCIRHALRANTRRGSRRNIAAHYDLGNAFYALWLDRGMNYSSALFTRHDETLEAAQDAKLRRVVELLDPQPGHRVLEIGCGWGALSERLVAHHGCRVTALTLSAAQFDFGRDRLRRSAPAADWDVYLRDYRDVEGRYDRIVSIEMLEAVGERYWPIYFEKLQKSLTETGVAVLQVITIAADRFERYRRRPDFIQRYIFPGGMLPTEEIIKREAARAGLRIVAHERFGRSYALTLAEWRRRFLDAWPHIEPLGFDARFKRMWHYYLSYCETGFLTGAVDVGQFKLVHATAGRSPGN
jgi:cyclopropane-fatty-acyl-phospholipid synthase